MKKNFLCFVILFILMAMTLPNIAFAGGDTGCLAIDKKDVDKLEWIIYPSSGFIPHPDNYYHSDYANSKRDGENGKYCFVDADGNELTPFIYDKYFRSFGGYAVAIKDGKYGLIDENGKEVIPFLYDFLFERHSYDVDLIVAQIGEKRGCINFNNEVVIDFVYDKMNLSVDNPTLFTVNAGDKMGCIDIDENVIVDFIYDGFMYYYRDEGLVCFHNGYAVVKKSEKYGLIDTNGYEIIPCTFDEKYLPYLERYCEGLILAYAKNSDEMFGYIDKDRNWVIEPRFYDAWAYNISNFRNGIAIVCLEKNKPIIIDTKGEPIVPDIFSYGSVSPGARGFESWYGDGLLVQVNGLGYGIMKPPTTTAKLSAIPTSSIVLVNGKSVSFDAYNIEGRNYFMLRDLAFVLSGTNKQFEVGWDSNTDAISLLNNKPYTVLGGEMGAKGDDNKTPTPTSSKIFLDGKDVSFTAYNIDGRNYFMLREIGQAFDFGIEWDEANNTIVIDTNI